LQSFLFCSFLHSIFYSSLDVIKGYNLLFYKNLMFHK